MRQTPNRIPANPPLRSGSDKHKSQFVALVFAIHGTLLIGGGSLNRGVPLQLCGFSATATLQSQHVRIQT